MIYSLFIYIYNADFMKFYNDSWKKLSVLGYAIMQLPDLLVAMHAYIRNRVVSMAATYNINTSRAENQVWPVQEVTPSCDLIEEVKQSILKDIQENVSKAEQRILDVVTKKLDANNRRINDIDFNS